LVDDKPSIDVAARFHQGRLSFLVVDSLDPERLGRRSAEGYT